MSADNDRVRSAGTTAGKVAGAGRQAADSAEDAGQQAMDSKPFRVLLTVGLIAYGVVHILIGWIALQIAWFGGGGARRHRRRARWPSSPADRSARRCCGSPSSGCSR